MGYSLEQLLEGAPVMEPRLCAVCNKRPVSSEKAKFCEECSQARRSWQLVVNNQKWRARIRDGKAEHRVYYNGKVTQWAKDNPVLAIRRAVDAGYSDEMLKQLLDELQ